MAITLTLLPLLFLQPVADADVDWPSVGNDRGYGRYSTLTQIDRDNVAELEVAWTWRTGELERGGEIIECTPLIIDGVMYVTTAYLRVAALDAATGEERWTFDPFAIDHPGYPIASGGVNRGLAWWSDGRPGGERRIFHGAADGRLFALDAHDGRLVDSFGEGGVVDLRAGIDRDLARLPYGPTSAPAVCHDVVVLGFSCGEGPGVAAPGDVRAFDVRTGKERWSFRTVPVPGEFGNHTWEGDGWRDRGGANAWGGVSVDVTRRMVFVGLGSASFDFYGGDRPGRNLFANSVVALDGRSGARIWHYQTLRHDLWDHDLPTCPTLVTVRHDGVDIDAVAQVTKTGYVFLFDRDTGRPLYPITEVDAPPSDVDGEQAWPTQPIPSRPPPFARTRFDEQDITDIDPDATEAVTRRYRTLLGGGPFTPPSLQGTIVIPGFHGGANWSGASFDPTTGLLYVNSNELANIARLVPIQPTSDGRPRFRIAGYERFLDPNGYPAIKPPWGRLNAIDLNRGEIAWQVPLGEHPELTARGIPRTGTHNFGGSIVTAGGIVFIGATADERFHAFDSATGELLWEHSLPAGGYATPSTYAVNGRQYVVIAAGGAGKVGTRAGDSFVAFALPR